MANIYDIELLNSIMNPKIPESVERKGPLLSNPSLMEEPYPPEYGYNFMGNSLPYLRELTPTTDMGATGITPQLAQGIMQLRNQSRDFGTSVDNFQGFTDKEDFLGETEQYETDKFGYRKQSNNKFGGIMDLLMGIAMPGYSLFKNIAKNAGKGLTKGLGSLNSKLQNSVFGLSPTLKDYFKSRKEIKEAREIANAPGTDNPDGTGGYSGGFDDSTGNYNDPYGDGDTE